MMSMTLPASVQEALAELLASAGDETAVAACHPVAGGDINQVLHLRTGGGEYLLKYQKEAGALPGFFAAEARGLELLREAGALRVPRVYGRRENPALLLLEWLPPPRGPIDRDRAAAALGRGLAQLHRVEGRAYGLGDNGYIGTLPQPGGWYPDWVTCWGRRLQDQAALAGRRGCFSGERARRFNRLLERLDRWIGSDPGGPALLHGDLWGGNWMVGPGGEPALIDPAVLYGSREVDLAMTHLFGGFPASFYAAYTAEYPLAPGYEERRPLYQLYYLLVHLTLFGEGYGPAVDRVLARYGGA